MGKLPPISGADQNSGAVGIPFTGLAPDFILHPDVEGRKRHFLINLDRIP
jgi:hypothetical protein